MSWDNHRIVKGYRKDNIMTKVKIYRNSGRSNIWHGTFIALWRVIKRQYNDQRHAEIVVEVIYVMGQSSLYEGLKKDNTMTKVKTDRNSGRSNICHGTFIALWRVIKRQYNDQSKDMQK